MAFQNNNEDAVVFFDFENIVYSLRNRLGENPNFEVLMDKCQEYGRITLARAYADWSRHNTVIAPLQASGFDPVFVPTYFYESKEQKARKNAVDIHIAIEAIDWFGGGAPKGVLVYGHGGGQPAVIYNGEGDIVETLPMAYGPQVSDDDRLAHFYALPADVCGDSPNSAAPTRSWRFSAL